MYCAKCGNLIEEGEQKFRFCSVCGAPLEPKNEDSGKTIGLNMGDQTVILPAEAEEPILADLDLPTVAQAEERPLPAGTDLPTAAQAEERPLPADPDLPTAAQAEEDPLLADLDATMIAPEEDEDDWSDSGYYSGDLSYQPPQQQYYTPPQQPQYYTPPQQQPYYPQQPPVQTNESDGKKTLMVLLVALIVVLLGASVILLVNLMKDDASTEPSSSVVTTDQTNTTYTTTTTQPTTEPTTQASVSPYSTGYYMNAVDSTVNLRAAPTINGNKIMLLAWRQVIYVDEIQEDPYATDPNLRWWGRTTVNGKTGWVALYLFTPTS